MCVSTKGLTYSMCVSMKGLTYSVCVCVLSLFAFTRLWYVEQLLCACACDDPYLQQVNECTLSHNPSAFVYDVVWIDNWSFHVLSLMKCTYGMINIIRRIHIKPYIHESLLGISFTMQDNNSSTIVKKELCKILILNYKINKIRVYFSKDVCLKSSLDINL